MAFENDIFISYAHIDNESLTEDRKGWISSFHHALEVRLAQLLGKRPTIFRDPKLQGNDDFSQRLVEALPKTATILSVISPRYVRSEWCVRELTEFTRAARTTDVGVQVGSRSRIFKVVKTLVPFEKHPEEAKDLLGYEFYTLDSATGRPHELDQDDSPENQRLYWAKLNDVAYDLSQMIEELERVGGAGAPAPAPAAAAATVFLAETSYDLREQRATLQRFLLQHGHTVLPDAQLPLFAEDCEAFLDEQLARCTMSIHLVGANYGIVPEGTDQSLVAIQNELAIRRGEADPGFQRLIWMPPGLETDDERQAKLIDTIHNDPRIQERADILQTPLGDVQLAIEQKLAPPTPAARATIYLAETSQGLDGERAALAEFLEGQGHTVLPDGPPPLFVDECEDFVREQLERCRMSIHPVGAHYGIVPDGTERSRIRIQLDVAREHGDPDLLRLIWIPDAETDDPRQEEFLELLDSDPEQTRGAEVLKVSRQALESAIAEKLRPPEEEEEDGEAAADADDDGLKRVYVLCDVADLDDLAPIEDVLYDKELEVVLPIFDGDETEIREEHEENLKNCDAVLLYYGAANEAWQRRMLREVKKAAGYGRTKPPPAAAIYVAPPETPQKKRLRTREAVVLQPEGDFTPEVLEPLIRELGGH